MSDFLQKVVELGMAEAAEVDSGMEVEDEGGGGGSDPAPNGDDDDGHAERSYWEDRTHSDDEADEALKSHFPLFHYGEVSTLFPVKHFYMFFLSLEQRKNRFI